MKWECFITKSLKQLHCSIRPCLGQEIKTFLTVHWLAARGQGEFTMSLWRVVWKYHISAIRRRLMVSDKNPEVWSWCDNSKGRLPFSLTSPSLSDVVNLYQSIKSLKSGEFFYCWISCCHHMCSAAFAEAGPRESGSGEPHAAPSCIWRGIAHWNPPQGGKGSPQCPTCW